MTEPKPAELATAPEVGATSKTWIFTYGSNHLDSSGSSLASYYTPITIEADELGTDEGYSAARAKMFEARGAKWSIQYGSEDEAGVAKWGYMIATLQEVAMEDEDMRRERVIELTANNRDRLNRSLAALDAISEIMMRLPRSLMNRLTVFDAGIDFDHLSREDATQVMRHIGGGKWRKNVNTSYAECLDYITEINGIRVRLWAASPPETCRVVEIEEEIPAQKIIRRKLVCSPVE